MVPSIHHVVARRTPNAMKRGTEIEGWLFSIIIHAPTISMSMYFLKFLDLESSFPRLLSMQTINTGIFLFQLK
jgi:hypothetical protein